MFYRRAGYEMQEKWFFIASSVACCYQYLIGGLGFI